MAKVMKPTTGTSAASSSTSPGKMLSSINNDQSSLLLAMQKYIELMLDRVPGMKVLLLDQETTGIVSMVYSQSQILEKEVFLVEKIENENQEKMGHLSVICLLRPTDKNFMLLSKHLKNPRYRNYSVFFTNSVPHHRLEQLACCDEREVVVQVQEIFADVYATAHSLFSLNQPSNIWMSLRNPVHWTAYEESIFQRHIEGLLAVLLSLQSIDGAKPVVRYAHGSVISQKLAHELSQRIHDEHTLFGGLNNAATSSSRTLLIYDRRDDPVTPLLNQWTYHAMVNELLGIENNRVDLSKAPGVSAEQKELVISTLHDPFFEENIYSNYGDLGANIKKYLAEFQEQTKNSQRIETVDDMRRFVDTYPEFRRLSGNVAKHVAVVIELSRIVRSCGLLDVSQIEQDLACTDAKSAHFDQVLQKLRSPDVNNMERLRLVLLFSLRYENERGAIESLKEELARHKIDVDQIALIDCLLQYAGASVRGGDLFSNKTWLNAGMSRLAKGLNFKGIENVYTQHTSAVKSVVDALIRGRLRESDFPFAPLFSTNSALAAKAPASNVVVFVVGGCTFEEARDMAQLSAEHRCKIVLGGSCLHSSKSFLADVAQLSRARY
ncbi:unnamed protein product [Amoebophrya sp. A25]|nr:unnamed protein product [Amoebophrya sp. A25]|eukprot:GSA25T00010296001.1